MKHLFLTEIGGGICHRFSIFFRCLLFSLSEIVMDRSYCRPNFRFTTPTKRNRLDQHVYLGRHVYLGLFCRAQVCSAITSSEYWRTGGRWFEPSARAIFLPRIDDRHRDRFHSSLTAVHFFGYVMWESS